MNKDVVICIGTIGSETFSKCKKSVDVIFKNNNRVRSVFVIKNKTPQSEWLNEMRRCSRNSEWCLQVDEDMYLNSNALDRLLEFAEKKRAAGVKILSACSLLYDIFLESNVGSLKLWNSNALFELEFKDVLGGDRDFAKRAKKIGYKIVETDLVLGMHDSAPNPGVAFKKYFEYTQKLRKFNGDEHAKRFSCLLKNKYLKKKSSINKKAYDGSTKALRVPIVNYSKRG